MYRTKPGDMAAKGFETAYYFTSILLKYGNDFMEHLNENNLAILHDFNFRPVYFIKNAPSPDYYENKHLFIMEIIDGETDREW
jgi:hypothetical protein